jgi:regulator of protease activity HflC (stomatin/prohibitin superfamily)
MRTFLSRLWALRLEVVMLFEVLAVLGGAALAAAAVSLRVVKQYERGLVFRFGRILEQVRGPGLAMIVPIADRLHKVICRSSRWPCPRKRGLPVTM